MVRILLVKSLQFLLFLFELLLLLLKDVCKLLALVLIGLLLRDRSLRLGLLNTRLTRCTISKRKEYIIITHQII